MTIDDEGEGGLGVFGQCLGWGRGFGLMTNLMTSYANDP